VKRIPGILAAIALAALPVAGAALEAPLGIRPTWGVLVESVLDKSDPAISPGLSFNFGAGVIMPLSPGSSYSFVPSADLYYYNAALNSSGRVVPTDESLGTAFVVGLLLDAPISYSLPLGNKFSMGLGMGLCLDLRIAFTIDQLKAGDTSLINRYLWDKARFLMPSTTIRFEYELTDRVSFGLKSRVMWPIYNLWANEGTGFMDHAKFLIDLAVGYKLAAGM
jgi:hypothetical protein